MFKQKASKVTGLKILIIGCGKVGTALISQLCQEGHDITVIDKNSEKVETNVNLYDVMGIVGNGSSYSVLMEAGVETADLVIAVTNSDELNILCCTIAKQGRDLATIARVRNPEYVKEVRYLRKSLGLTMIINPELETATEVARVLYMPTALEINSFAHGQAEMTKIKIPENNMLVGMKLADLGQKLQDKNGNIKILVCAVEREGEVYIPSGSFEFKSGDVVTFVGNRRMTKVFMDYIGFKTNRVNNTLIVGGGDVAYYLAEQLINVGIDVKIIEQDKKRCEQLSILLPKAVIINADGTDEKILNGEGIQDAESFVALTGIDEENILLTLHVRHVSNAKTITKINRSNFKQVINSLDLGSVFYPSFITAETISTYVRAKSNTRSLNSSVKTLIHLFDYRAEALEFRIDEASEVTDVPLMDLKLKNNLLVAFINKNGNIIMPSGQDKIEVGDTAMIVTTHTGFNDIRDILA